MIEIVFVILEQFYYVYLFLMLLYEVLYTIIVHVFIYLLGLDCIKDKWSLKIHLAKTTIYMHIIHALFNCFWTFSDYVKVLFVVSSLNIMKKSWTLQHV